ncbi:MAG TPA: hypothetical protein VN457_04655, partial [Chlamydiales bacterium]|nr:hypothetical protein [Chlamydiales bacterium]
MSTISARVAPVDSIAGRSAVPEVANQVAMAPVNAPVVKVAESTLKTRKSTLESEIRSLKSKRWKLDLYCLLVKLNRKKSELTDVKTHLLEIAREKRAKKQQRAAPSSVEVPVSSPAAPSPIPLPAKRKIDAPYRAEIFGATAASEKVVILLNDLLALAPMDKFGRTDRGWDREASRMERFLATHFGMENIADYWFVHGVKGFRLNKDISKMNPETIFTLQDPNKPENRFQMTVQEIIAWQKSFVVFAAQDQFTKDQFTQETGRKDIQRFLEGKVEAGPEAWKMKFVIRISKSPIFAEFDGNVIHRNAGEEIGDVRLVSVCGADFAGREHDVGDILEYITNWKEVYKHENGKLIFPNGRDFVATKVAAKLDEKKLLADLKKMALLRLKAQDALGIEVVVETGIGLGVFAGDAIGIGKQVREISARALKEVLE